MPKAPEKSKVWVVTYTYWSGEDGEPVDSGLLGVFTSQERASEASKRAEKQRMRTEVTECVTDELIGM